MHTLHAALYFSKFYLSVCLFCYRHHIKLCFNWERVKISQRQNCTKTTLHQGSIFYNKNYIYIYRKNINDKSKKQKKLLTKGKG